MIYNIADIAFEVSGIKNPLAEERMEKYRADFHSDDKFVVECLENDNILFPQFESISRKVNNWKWCIDGEYVHMYDVNPRFDFVLSSMSWNSKTKRAVIQAHDTCPFTGVELSVILFNLMGMMFGYVLPDYNGIAFHSSAIAYQNNGILFSAPPGTGKSTHTGLWRKLYADDTVMINDDRPIIRKTDSGLYVYGAPWSGKTSINSNVKVPLKAIVCIRRGEKNTIRQLNTSEAFVNLFNETYTIPVEHYMSKVIDVLNVILESIPVYELKCTISDEAVELVKSTLCI